MPNKEKSLFKKLEIECPLREVDCGKRLNMIK